MDKFERITNIVKEALSGKESHSWEHTERVLNLCLHIGKKENADLEVLRYAAVLHDIARKEQDESQGKICHAELGAKKSRIILEKEGFDTETTNKIVHCIETHRFRKNLIPESKEAKILFDADKLDCIGAIGIGRAFMFAAESGAKIHDKNINYNEVKEYSRDDTAAKEFFVKLCKVKDRLFTNEGKKLAKERHNFMITFFDRLDKETDGEL